MNKKQKRGIIVLFALLALIVLPLADPAELTCCFHPDNFCQNVASPEECCNEPECDSSIYDPVRPCSETKCEWQGCCLQTCTMTQYKDCNYEFVPISELAPTYTCESAPECAQGCCVYMTQGSNLASCEITTQAQCQPDPLYPNVQFHSGLSGEECNAICEINETPSGNLEGYVIGKGSSQAISGAEIVVSGITSISNSEGYYQIEDIPSGQITIEVYAQGYNQETVPNIIIQPEQTTSHDIFLEESASDKGLLTGYIKNSAGQGVFGYVYYSQDSTFTDSNGKYTLEDIPSGQIELTAVADYYIPSTEYVQIRSDQLNYHDFNLTSESQEELCGNGILNFGEECEPGMDDACPGLCQDCQCPDSCAGASGYCYSWEYQCESMGGSSIDIQGLDLCSAYDYDGSSYGCCDTQPEEIPPCIDGTLNNQPVSGTDFGGSTGSICKCGNQYINTSDSEYSEGYCCDDTYHTSAQSCTLAGLLSGYVLQEGRSNTLDAVDGSPQEPVPNADLEFTKVFTDEIFSTSTSAQGFYILNLPAGNYSLLLTKAGYDPYSAIVKIKSAETKEINFSVSKSETYCSAENITSPKLSINHTKGSKELALNWEQGCLDYVDHFEIYRDSEPLASAEEFSYTDNSVEWDTTYTYSIHAISLSGSISESNQISINTGSSECEDKTSQYSWCLDETKRVICNDKNQPVLWDGYIEGSENGDCTIAMGNGSICQQEDGKTWCTMPEDCSETGLENKNIFGLFYNLAYPDKTCLYTDVASSDPQRRYCYYDAYDESWTTVDRCLSCSPEMTCFDYNTEEACTQDNCLVGESIGKDCEWVSTYENFHMLGKGYCAPKDYTGTDYCSLCGPSSEVFLNTKCDYEICSSLGNCYSAYNNTECISCTQDTTCQQYLTEEDCIGPSGQPFDISGNCGSSYSLQYSQDSCNLGTCAWKNGECIKDANADGKDDCQSEEACLKDNEAPHTKITNPPSYINKKGSTLLFEVEEEYEVPSTYYCLGDECCPDEKIVGNTIFLDGIHPKLQDKQGSINISYYSVDSNNNVEQIKTQSLSIDTKEPSPSLYYTVENSTKENRSDMYINLSFSEPVFCSESFSPGNNSLLHDTYIEKSTRLNYTDLEDGRYQLLVRCRDIHQNEVSKRWNISIDRYHKIVEESPNMETLSDNQTNISLITLKDQLYCYYQEPDSPIKSPFNEEKGGQGIKYGEDYIYNTQIGNLSSGTYSYNLECYNQPEGKMLDSSHLTFTIDNHPPSTELFFLNMDGKYRKAEDKAYSLLNFDLRCTDYEQPAPGESGCGPSYFCITKNESCTPDSQFLEPQTFNIESGTPTICYYSIDNLGNGEQINCEKILLDKSDPFIEITNPDMSLTTEPTQEVVGYWNETSNISIYVKTRSAENIISESVKAEINSNEKSFSANLDLFQGYNQITATAYDSAGNKYSDSTVIYYDNVGPGIKEISIEDNNDKNDPDTDHKLEYGSDIFISLIANDYQYSDIYEELTKDVQSCNITISCKKCVNNSTIISEDMLYNNETGRYYFLYNYDKHGLLEEGEYIATFGLVDQFGNPARHNYSLEIIDTTSYSLEIYNHNNNRIDTLSSKGESGHPITFSFVAPRPIFLEQSQLKIVHENPSKYSKTYDIGPKNNSFDFILYDYLPEGRYNVYYELTSDYGKTYQQEKEFNIADTLPAAFNISIEKDGKSVESVSYGIYNLKISPLEPVYEISSLKYSFNGKEDTIKDLTGSGYEWRGKLYISPTPDYSDLNDVQATFKISSTDHNDRTGGEILYGETFKINTKGPGTPTVFQPLPSLSYTDKENVYFSGKSPEWNPENDIVFKRNLASSDILDPRWEKVGLAEVRQNNQPIHIWENSAYGPIVLISQNQIRINDPAEVFEPGSYMEFNTLKTQDYLYRKITDVSLYSDPDGIEKYFTITFEPAIRDNISSYQGSKTYQDIYIYDDKYPEGWFDGSIPLKPGTNYITLQTRSKEGTYGEHSPVYEALYDPESPNIDRLSPLPDSYTNRQRPLIEARVTDSYSGASKEDLVLEIQEENYSISCGQEHCQDEDGTERCSSLYCFSNKDNSEINISYLSPTSLISGWKEVTIHSEDRAGNKIDKKWGFWVDGLAPSTPSLELSPGNKVEEGSPYTYYTNQPSPSFTVSFAPYEVIELGKYTLEKGTSQIDTLTLEQKSDNLFEGSLKESLQQGEYFINLEAKKMYPNGTWSKYASWRIPFVVDTTPPSISASMPQSTNGRNTLLNLSYTEQNPYYLEFVEGASGTIGYKDLHTPMQTIINLTPEQGEKSIKIKLVDKAGNSATQHLKTYLDSKGPQVSDDYQKDGMWVRKPQKVTLSASDENGINKVLYCTVTGCNPLTDGTELEQPYQILFDEEIAANISYAAIDSFSNPSEIGYFRMLYDLTNPEIEIYSPKAVPSRQIILSGTYQDENIERIEFTGDITPTKIWPEKAYSSFYKEINLTPEQGEKEITATAYDQAGNTAKEQITVNLDYDASPVVITNVEGASKTDGYFTSKEDAVTIKGYHIFSDDIRIYPEQNPSNKADINGQEFSVLVSSADGYEKVEGQEKTNIITLIADDYSGDKYETDVKIINDQKDPHINLEKPKTGFTSQLRPTIEVSTEEASTCTLSYSVSGTDRAQDMDTEDGSYHTAKLQDTIKDDMSITVSCQDAASREAEFSFTLYHDSTKPTIYHAELSEGELTSRKLSSYSFLLFTTNSSSIEVFANEPVRCKYGKSPEYSSMQKFSGFEDSFGAQRISKKIDLGQGDSTIYVVCEDKAGNLASPIRMDISVNTDMPIQIIDAKPSKYLNDPLPEISFKTYRNSSCEVTAIEESSPLRIFDSSSYSYKEESQTFVEKKDNRFIHTAKLSGPASESFKQTELQDDATYSLAIDCSANDEGVEDSETYPLDFQTDFTPPKISIEQPQNGINTEDSFLDVIAKTEENVNYTLFVNQKQQSYSSHSDDGKIDDFVILEDGDNTLRIEVVDKAGNKAQRTLFIKYNNQGPTIEIIEPTNGDALPPIGSIKAKTEATADTQATDFVLFTFDKGQEVIPDVASISGSGENLNIMMNAPYNPLPENNYRAYIIPVDRQGQRGEGMNLLFSIGNDLPEIFLSSPYSEKPYRGMIVNNPETRFKGMISSENLLLAELFINGEKVSQFNNKEFSITPTLQQGKNSFTLKATNLQEETAIKKGSMILDSEGPEPTIDIE